MPHQNRRPKAIFIWLSATLICAAVSVVIGKFWIEAAFDGLSGGNELSYSERHPLRALAIQFVLVPSLVATPVCFSVLVWAVLDAFFSKKGD